MRYTEGIAILGTGSIAHSHANAIRHCGKQIDLVVNPHVEAAQQFALLWNIPQWSGDFSALFCESISDVHVCTPAGVHYEQVKALLLHGKNVLCEKPLCLKEDEALELAKLAREKGVRAAIDLNVRFNPACIAAREMIQSDSFGDIWLTHGTYLQEFEILPTAYTWRYREEVAGNMRAVTEIGSHWIDLLYFLTGLRIRRVSACFNRLQKDRVIRDNMMYSADPATATEGNPVSITETDVRSDTDRVLHLESEDAAIISYELENGRFGSLVLSEISAGHQNTIEITVSGAKQTISWNADEPTKLCYAEKGGPLSVRQFAFGNNGFNDTICELVKAYYEDVVSDMLPTFGDGVYLVAVCQAIYRSANQDGTWVVVEDREKRKKE